MKITDEQRDFLAQLPADGRWRYMSINRSGYWKDTAAVRQQCRLKGLAEHNSQAKRNWRITAAGLAALAGAKAAT